MFPSPSTLPTPLPLFYLFLSRLIFPSFSLFLILFFSHYLLPPSLTTPPFLSLSFSPLTPILLLTSPISLPSLPLSLGGNMKGYLCADSQGRSRAES